VQGSNPPPTSFLGMCPRIILEHRGLRDLIIPPDNLGTLVWNLHFRNNCLSAPLRILWLTARIIHSLKNQLSVNCIFILKDGKQS
ncbi:hypothetical protein L9F63_020503, partial [Diploptera punctata]